MNIIREIVRFLNYNNQENFYTDNSLDEEYMTEDEYKSKLILGLFTKDGLILILSNITICALLIAIFFIFFNK